MKVLMGRYISEILSLSVMLLMIVALIAGQADARVDDPVRPDSGLAATTLAASLETAFASSVIRADIVIDLRLNELAEIALDGDTKEVLRELIELRLRVED